jgi:hypothetical protein
LQLREAISVDDRRKERLDASGFLKESEMGEWCDERLLALGSAACWS